MNRLHSMEIFQVRNGSRRGFRFVKSFPTLTSMTIRPAGWSLTAMLKNTFGLAMSAGRFSGLAGRRFGRTYGWTGVGPSDGAYGVNTLARTVTVCDENRRRRCVLSIASAALRRRGWCARACRHYRLPGLSSGYLSILAGRGGGEL